MRQESLEGVGPVLAESTEGDCTDRRMTPHNVVGALERYAGGPVCLDPCTEPHNPVGALEWFYEEKTGGKLWGNWGQAAYLAWLETQHESRPARTLVYYNPPFTNRRPWDLEGIKAAQQRVCPVDVATLAVHEANSHTDLLNRHAVARCDMYKRLRCRNPASGELMDVARSAAVWLLSGDLTVFAESFRDVGYIVPLDVVRALTGLQQV